ncbi:MAG: ABC transporter permease [Spirochaetales bacterium]|nr:ABC transporter permease [Spirochaetales bacterium]
MKLVLLALRNLQRQKKRTIFLIVAIAISSMLSAIMYSFSGGVLNNMTENASNIFAGHVYLYGKERLNDGRIIYNVDDGQKILELLENSGVPYNSYSVRTEIMQSTFYFESNSVWQSIIGFSPENEKSFLERVPFVAGGFDGLSIENGIIISSKSAEKLKIRLNDTLTAKVKDKNSQFSAVDFQVVGIMDNIDLFGVSTSYTNIEYLNKVIGLEPGAFQSLGIYFSSIEEVDSKADALFEALSKDLNFFPRPEKKEKADSIYALFLPRIDDDWSGIKYEFETINDRMKDIREAENVIKIVTTIVMIFIYLVICVGIANTFSIVMIERFKEIGTMRALGMQRGTVSMLFVLEALFMSIIGVVVGLASGALLMSLVYLIPFGTNGPLFLFLKNGHFTFVPDIFWIGLNTFLIVFFTFASILGTAIKASRLSPVEALSSVK